MPAPYVPKVFVAPEKDAEIRVNPKRFTWRHAPSAVLLRDYLVTEGRALEDDLAAFVVLKRRSCSHCISTHGFEPLRNAAPMKDMIKSTAVSRHPLPKELLLPILRAYAFAYLSTSSLQLIKPILSLVRGKEDVRKVCARVAALLRQGTRLESFPACAAILIGASTVVPKLISDAWAICGTTAEARRDAPALRRSGAVRFAAVFVAALAVFRLLNRDPAPKEGPDSPDFASADVAIAALSLGGASGDCKEYPRKRNRRGLPPRALAGKTLFATSFGVVNATVVLASTLLAYSRKRQTGAHAGSPTASSAAHRSRSRWSSAAPAAGFIASSAIIMWAWFYTPDRLPQDYNRWITSAAQLDKRVVQALRQCRLSEVIYGADTGQHCPLMDMAGDLNMPKVWGDPVKCVPVPCELIHSGSGQSCEWHALSRFARAWLFAMRMYAPLNLAILVRSRPSVQKLSTAMRSASRSSSFLALFVALFYYGVCLCRTRIGPLVLGRDKQAWRTIDSGLCVGAGCFACGWSIFVERAARRTEMALFVAPRAMTALLPREYQRKHMVYEQLAFALSAGTILAAAHSKPANIPGMFGRIIRQIYN